MVMQSDAGALVPRLIHLKIAVPGNIIVRIYANIRSTRISLSRSVHRLIVMLMMIGLAPSLALLVLTTKSHSVLEDLSIEIDIEWPKC